MATARVIAGTIRPAVLAAAGRANRSAPAEQRLLDILVRDAVGAYKKLARGRRWEAVAAVERMGRSLTGLRGRRDDLQLEPAEPARALAAVLVEAEGGWDLGSRRRALIDRVSALGGGCSLNQCVAADQGLQGGAGTVLVQ